MGNRQAGIRAGWAIWTPSVLLLVACGSGGPLGIDDETEPVQDVRSDLVNGVDARAVAARRAEVDEYIANWHASAGHRVLRTVTEDNGDMVDLVAAESVPGSQGSPPPPTFKPDRPELRNRAFPLRIGAGDPSLVRFVRPTFDHYVTGAARSDSLLSYLAKLPVGIAPTGFAPGAPCADNCERLYAASRQNVNSRGAFSWMNARWSPGEVQTNTFFLSQMNVIDLGTNIKTNAEWIGWIIGRNPQLNGPQARFYSEFFTQGMSNTGPYVGGWAGTARNAGFIPMAGALVALDDQVPGISTVDGDQYDQWMFMDYFPSSSWNCGTGCTGSWWLGVNSGWVGHYPVGAASPNVPFDLIASSAPNVDWYGEVYDASPGTWTSTDMGSAQFASSSSTWQQTGWFAEMGYRRASDYTPLYSTLTEVAEVGGDDPDCYTRYEETFWNTTVWYGGPGRTGTGVCDPF